MRVRLVAGPFRVRWALAGLLAAFGLFGCFKPQTPPPAEKTTSTSESAPSTQTTDRLTQKFSEAKCDPPEGWQPVDSTMTGKSIGTLYTKVEKLWDSISFTTPEGKRLNYSATLETDLGTIEIDLLADLAPNHVRNFVALAQAGYYDGLVFERIVSINKETDPDVEKGQQLDLIEGGGPLGVADTTYNCLGYCLKAETQKQVVHKEGTVGACHGPEPNSAACKFYIILGSPSASLDDTFTIFGTVVKGIDVAHKIHKQPVVEKPDDTRGCHCPEKPVVIRKVTIQTREGDTAVSKQDKK